MTGIRYEFSKDGISTGFLTGLENYFTISEICLVCGIFEEKLANPSINMKNTKSFFTLEGNKKFRKTIRKIARMAENKGIEFIKVVKEISKEDILFLDKYQIITDGGYTYE